MPNKKIVFIILSILLVLPVTGQVNTYSPYSRFGLGELRLPGFGQGRAMGASGIAIRSNKQINYINPASYTAIDTMSFIFDFGIKGSSTNYMDGELTSNLKNVNLDHLAIAFSINDWWKASAGVSPYSYTGYSILEQGDNPELGLVDYSFEGDGGLNRLYVGTSFKLFNKLSIGVNMNNFFGYLENTKNVSFPGDIDASESYMEDRMVISGRSFNFGLQYHETFAEKYFVNLGVIYEPESKLKSEQTLLIHNIYSGNAVALNDSTIINPQFELERTENSGEVIYPQKLGAGLAFGLTDRLIITGEYSTQKWSESRIMGESDSLINSNSYNFGVEVTPNPQALRGYFNRVNYRVGGYYSNSYLSIRGEQINDYGITFGVGLPFKGTNTTFNLGMVLGQRGTTDNNLIKENYGIINVSFTLHDFWFFKRKFD